MTRIALNYFIPLAVGLTALLGVSYINDQQILRGGANEPQLGIAESLATTLSTSPATTSDAVAVAIESSLMPYTVVFDAYGNPVAGSGRLNGELPTLPAGIFDVLRSKGGEDVFTWQPETGVRQAVVVVPVNDGSGGFVMAGRSLKYVEQEEDALTKRAFFGWIAMMLATFFSAYIAARLRH